MNGCTIAQAERIAGSLFPHAWGGAALPAVLGTGVVFTPVCWENDEVSEAVTAPSSRHRAQAAAGGVLAVGEHQHPVAGGRRDGVAGARGGEALVGVGGAVVDLGHRDRVAVGQDAGGRAVHRKAAFRLMNRGVARHLAFPMKTSRCKRSTI